MAISIPVFAAKTVFSEDDLALLWKALGNLFELDRSAARGTMSARGLYIFKHESKLGNAQAQRLFESHPGARRRTALKARAPLPTTR